MSARTQGALNKMETNMLTEPNRHPAKQRIAAWILALAGVLAASSSGLAHVSPGTCSASSLVFTTERSPAQGPVGTITSWNIRITNADQAPGDACDNWKLDARFACPAPAGQPATTPCADPNAPIKENCFVQLLTAPACTADADCTAAALGSPLVNTFQGCITDTIVGGSFCGIRGNNPPAANTNFYSTQCRIVANPGVTQVTGGIVAMSELHDADQNTTGQDLSKFQSFNLQSCAVEVDKQCCSILDAQGNCASTCGPGGLRTGTDPCWRDVGNNDNVAQVCTGVRGG